MTFTAAENGTTLRGWFLKEKRDKFKRRKSLVSSSSNRRWFQIERLGGGENALCYYKRQPKKDEQPSPTGFFFLNDIISLSQDIHKKMITLEHPTRILRIESPSIAQHTHSYSALVRSCPKATKECYGTGNSTPSQSFYGSSSSSTLNTGSKNTSGEATTTTTADELKFLREITGNNNLAHSYSSSSSESGIQDTSDSSSFESDKDHFVSLPTTENEKEEEKSAVEPLYYHGNGREDDGTESAFSVDKLIAALPMTDDEIPKSNSFTSHQIQRSSSYRHHFGDDDIPPDADFLHDDWDD